MPRAKQPTEDRIIEAFPLDDEQAALKARYEAGDPNVCMVSVRQSEHEIMVMGYADVTKKSGRERWGIV
jgi:hypothetical protein